MSYKRLGRNERRLSNAQTEAANKVFKWLNRGLFGGELPAVRFLYTSTKRSLCADFSKEEGLIRLSASSRTLERSSAARSIKAETEAETLPLTLAHEMVHLWQAPIKVRNPFTLREYMKLREEGRDDEIERREKEDKAYFIMHDRQFVSKARETGLDETYSGRTMQYTSTHGVIQGSPLDSLLKSMDSRIDDAVMTVARGLLMCE